MITSGLVNAQINSYKYNIKFYIVGCILYWPMLILVFLFMVYLRKNNLVTSGDFMFVMTICIAISHDLWGFITGLSDFMKAMGDFKSSFEILKPHTGVIDKNNAKDLVI